MLPAARVGLPTSFNPFQTVPPSREQRPGGVSPE